MLQVLKYLNTASHSAWALLGISRGDAEVAGEERGFPAVPPGEPGRRCPFALAGEQRGSSLGEASLRTPVLSCRSLPLAEEELWGADVFNPVPLSAGLWSKRRAMSDRLAASL